MEALDAPIGSRHDDAVLERVRDGRQADRHGRARQMVCMDERAQVEIADGVTRDHEEGLAQPVSGEAHRAGRAERLRLDRVLELHLELVAVGEVRS